MDLFAEGLERISTRLKLLKPQPVRDIPILVGGAGEKKTLPLVGRYASIWHSSLELEAFRRKNDLVRRYAAKAGRDETLIERAITWPGDGASADSYIGEGVTLFTTEIHPTDQGYDLSPLKELLAWRGTGGR
jgi:alkanesulfonate monooxygenase SsuD/methylene tetrahydromethanopterin reductase-like flavin-dependent oxidoreductase (luciferase family)